MTVCEDWDLWQRLARTGIRFAHVPEMLAVYPLSVGSASMDAESVPDAGLRVIERGHGADPRVATPAAAYRDGMGPEHADGARALYVAYCAGLAIGSGSGFGRTLLPLRCRPARAVDPDSLANILFSSIAQARGRAPEAWTAVWPEVEGEVDSLLSSLEQVLDARGLAARARAGLERRIARHCTHPSRARFGCAISMPQDVCAVFADIDAHTGAEWLACRLTTGPEPLGTVELPVFDGFVPAPVLEDAVAAAYGWTLWNAFFERTMYPSLRISSDGDTVAVWRGSVCLARGLAGSEHAIRSRLHAEVGWTVFLQELWGLPEWSLEDLYAPNRWPDGASTLPTASVVDVEIGIPLPHIDRPSAVVRLRVQLAGETLGMVPVPTNGVHASAGELRVAIIRAAELYVGAARRCLLGWPRDDSTPLRQRLTSRRPAEAPATDSVPTVHVARSVEEGLGTSASRHAALPSALADLYVSDARNRGTRVLPAPPRDGPARWRYRPDLVDDTLVQDLAADDDVEASGQWLGEDVESYEPDVGESPAPRHGSLYRNQ